MAPMKLQFKSATMLLILFVPNMHAQNFWQHTPFQGQGGSICIDQNDRIFVGDGNQGVYRSTDNGENWMQVNNGLTRTNIGSMATGPNGDVFAGSDLGALYRSTDGGESWRWVSDTTAGYVESVAIDSMGTIFYGTLAYFGSTANLFRSTDNGVTWISLNLGVIPRDISRLALKSPGNIFASVDTFGVFHSTDNGTTWTQSLNNIAVTALDVNRDGHVLAGTFGSLILRTTNDGGSWIPVNSGFPGQLVRSLSHNASDHMYASVHHVTFGWGLLYRSTDDGVNWLGIATGIDSSAVYSIASSLSTGIYYYRLRAENVVDTKRLLLIR